MLYMYFKFIKKHMMHLRNRGVTNFVRIDMGN
jgi:hypothetical protein